MKNIFIMLAVLMMISSVSADPFAPEDCHHGMTPCSKDFCTAACPCDGRINYLPAPPFGGHPIGNGAGNCMDDSDCSPGSCQFNVGDQYECPVYTQICVFTAYVSSSLESSSSSSSSIGTSSMSSSSYESSSSSSSSSSFISIASPSSSSSSSSAASTSSSSSSSFLVSTSSSSVYSSSSSSSSVCSTTSSSAISSSSSSSSSSTLAAPKYFGQTYPYSCSREYGMLANFSTTTGYTEFNISVMKNYVLPAARNIYISTVPASAIISTNRRDDNTLLIQTNANAQAYVLIAGWDKSYSYALVAAEGSATIINLNASNFLNYADTYEVLFKNELTDDNWSYVNIANQTLFVKCADYSQFIVDLKYLNNLTGLSWVYLATREQPSLQVVATDTSGNKHQREQKMPAGNNIEDFYLIPVPFTKNVYSFSLVDYTGQYASAEFQAKTHISYRYPQIFSRDFDNARYVMNFECIPDHDYNIIVCNNNAANVCVSLGKITCLINDTKMLVINSPSFGNVDYNFNDLQSSWTSTASNVGLTYSGQRGTVKNVVFNVYDTSVNYTLVYSSNLFTQAGTFTYALPNPNSSYYVEGVYNTTTHGVLHSGIVRSLGNMTFSNAFNMTSIGSSYMGLSRVALLSIASLILVVTILLIAGKATSLGIGIISASLSWGCLYGFGWISHSIPFWIFFIFFFIGVAVKWTEGRAEVIS